MEKDLKNCRVYRYHDKQEGDDARQSCDCVEYGDDNHGLDHVGLNAILHVARSSGACGGALAACHHLCLATYDCQNAPVTKDEE